MIDLSFPNQRLIRVDFGARSSFAEQDQFAQQVLQDRIGRQLRDMYSDLMEQPLPERLAALLSQLESAPQGEDD
jgi:hypothetical protein